MGFYGPGIYLASLKAHHGWSTTLISFAITMYYLISATMILFIGDVFKRFGPRRVVLVGIIAMGAIATHTGWSVLESASVSMAKPHPTPR